MNQHTKMIVCFGDSNTHGYDSSCQGRFNENERWTCLLEKYLGEGYLVREEGLSGRTTVFNDPLFEGLSGLDVMNPCLLSHEPVDLLIIMLGTNDVKSRFCATPMNISQGLSRLVTKAIMTKDAWYQGKPEILIIAPPPITPEYVDDPNIGEQMGPGCDVKSRALAPLFKQVARDLGCHYIDAATLEGVAMTSTDHMHLGRSCHQALAEALALRIPAILADRD